MSSRLLFRLTAVTVLAAGLVMAVAGAAMSVWAWNTAETQIAFRLGLPLATALLVFTLVRLVRVLPEAWRGEEQARDPLTALAAAPKTDVDERLKKTSHDALSGPRLPLNCRRSALTYGVQNRPG
jgi:hypothetical protein